MADKTTGGLPAVEEATIGSLPGIADLYDDTKIPVEQQGEARHMTGAQWKQYAKAGVSQYVEAAQEAASSAQQAVAAVGTSVQQAAASATAAQTAKEGAEAAQEAIEDMEVSADTLPTGQAASVTKVKENGHVKLIFGLPAGATGAKGDPGSSIQSIERTAGTGAAGTVDTYTITLTDSTTSTFQVYNGADGTGSGDMLKSIYDKKNRNEDIFEYVDEKTANIPTPDDLVTVPGSGSIDMPDTLGPGPYAIKFTEEGVSESVNSFNGRTGAIIPQSGDYTASMVGAPSIEQFNQLNNNIFYSRESVFPQVTAPRTAYYGASFPIGGWDIVYLDSHTLNIHAEDAGIVFFPRYVDWEKDSIIAKIGAFSYKFGRYNTKTPVDKEYSVLALWVDEAGATEDASINTIINPITYNTWDGISIQLSETYAKPKCWLIIKITGQFQLSLE